MTEFPVLVDLGLVVIGAALTVLAGRRLGVPPILAYMAGGLVLGPATGLLTPGESLHLISELGIALLLFLVGLELSLEKIRDVGGTAVVVGLVQVSVIWGLGAAAATAFGFGPADAAILGLGLTFSSTVVVVKLLDRAGAMGTLHGRLAIGILLVQDVVVALALTLLGGAAGGEGAGLGAVLGGMRSAATGIAVLGVVTWVAVRFVLPRPMGWLARSGEALFVAALAWCFVLVLLAEAFHLSIELGAFVAGVGLAQLPWAEELEGRVHHLVNLFLAVFFVSLAAGMDLGAAGRLWPAALALSAFVIVAKPALIALLLARTAGGRDAFLAGLTLGQISEFAFVLSALAASTGVLSSPDVVPLLGLVGLITIGASAVLVPRGDALWAGLSGRVAGRGRRVRRGGAGDGARAASPARVADGGGGPDGGEDAGGHVVVVGMNTLGRDVVRRFAARGERVVAVDTDPAKLAGLPARTVFGSADTPSVLERAGIAEARLVVSALQIEDVNALLTWRCQRLGVPVSIHAFDFAGAEELTELGADHLMISQLDGIGEMEAELRRLGALD